MRAWVEGAKTSNGRLRVRITQSGREEIVSTDGNVFRFNHDPVSKIFEYDIETKEIKEDANFGIGQNDGKVDKIYAAIGPFSDWQIQILAKDNLGLDLSGATMVTLEFHITNYVFNA